MNDVSTAPKSVRQPITVTINRQLLERFDAVGRETGRNRSELIDRVIEHYLATRADADIEAANRHVADARRN